MAASSPMTLRRKPSLRSKTDSFICQHSAPWLAGYIHELIPFPAGRHDDQVDSTAQALAWTKRLPDVSAGWDKDLLKLELKELA